MRQNIYVGIAYLEAWLRGNGCVPLYNLMEDAATAEISRAQVWQWVKHHGAKLNDGRVVDRALCEAMIADDARQQRAVMGERHSAAASSRRRRQLFADLIFADEFPEFLTLPAYERVTADR